MRRLFNFIYQNRAFFTFLVLEIFSAALIINNHQYQGAQYFNSSSQVAASMLAISQDITLNIISFRRVKVMLLQFEWEVRPTVVQEDLSASI